MLERMPAGRNEGAAEIRAGLLAVHKASGRAAVNRGRTGGDANSTSRARDPEWRMLRATPQAL